MDGKEIVSVLARKWTRELDYRLIKELWAFTNNRIAVRFAYEWHDASRNRFRSYGNENWEFNESGLMRVRLACINDLPIPESERKVSWPLGPRPDDHQGFSDLAPRVWCRPAESEALDKIFTSQLRIRESVKRLFTPYDLPLVKRGELIEFNQTASPRSLEKRTRGR